MAFPFSSFVLKSGQTQNYVEYNPNGNPHGVLQATGERLLSPYTKLQVERSSTRPDSPYVNIKSSYNNKYWMPFHINDKWVIVAGAVKPNENEQSCELSTLFEFVKVQSTDADYHIYHVALQRYVRPDDQSSILVAQDCPGDIFTVIDWDSLVILPNHVSFKGYGYNDHANAYVVAKTFDNNTYLSLFDTDGADPRVANEVQEGDGRLIRIKYIGNESFWRRDPKTNWILVEPSTPDDRNGWFWVDRFDYNPNVVVLKNLGNDKFINKRTKNSVGSCLEAFCSDCCREPLVVTELVQSRKIFDLKFRLVDARIIYTDDQVLTTGTASNPDREPITVLISLVYSNTWTSTWNTIVDDPSFSSLIETTLSSPKQFLDPSSHIFRSGDYNGPYIWGKPITQEIPIEMQVRVDVPPLSKVTVKLLATKALVDIPFDYSQTDTLSYNNNPITYHKNDGIYTGVRFYNYHSNKEEEPLSV